MSSTDSSSVPASLAETCRIRPAASEDAAAFLDLVRTARRDRQFRCGESASIESVSDYGRRFQPERGYFCLVACANEHVVAFCDAAASSDGRGMIVLGIACRAERRREKIGSALLNAVKQEALRRNMFYLKSEVLLGNDSGLSFFLAHQFAPLPCRDDAAESVWCLHPLRQELSPVFTEWRSKNYALLTHPGVDRLVEDNAPCGRECRLWGRFPLTIAIVNEQPLESLAGFAEIAACSALRAKGHKLQLVVARKDTAQVNADICRLTNYFDRLGEANMSLFTAAQFIESAARPGAGCDIVISSSGKYFSPTAFNLKWHSSILELQDRSAGGLGGSPILHEAWRRVFFPFGRSASCFGLNWPEDCSAGAVSRLQAKFVELSASYGKPKTPAQASAGRLMQVFCRADSWLAIEELTKLSGLSLYDTLAELRSLFAASEVQRSGRLFANRNGAPIKSAALETASAAAPAIKGASGIPATVLFVPGIFGYDTNDPQKCSGVCSAMHGFACASAQAPTEGILLDPTAPDELSQKDLDTARRAGLILVDAPWYLLPEISAALQDKAPRLKRRRMTGYLQQNPYYQETDKLSTASALALALEILGDSKTAGELLVSAAQAGPLQAPKSKREKAA